MCCAKTDLPRRLLAGDPALPDALGLIRSAFAYMDGIVDPPSSVHFLTLSALGAGPGDVWVIGAPPVACAVFTPKSDALYIGKLAVRPDARGKGLARRLINLAENRARALGLTALEMQTRIELSQNHAAFAAMGFSEVARTAHPGYDRPTSLTHRRAVPPGLPPGDEPGRSCAAYLTLTDAGPVGR
jgi:GNAT superfamily N-acetyltransferase